MKKDKFIEKKLYEYIDNIQLSEDIIQDALHVMRSARPKDMPKSFAGRVWPKVLAGAAMAVAAAFVLIWAVHTMEPEPPVPTASPSLKYYIMKDLGRRSIEISALPAINPDIALLSLPNMRSACYLYFDRATDATAAVSMKYGVLHDRGMDEVYVIADLRKGLKDFTDFRHYQTTRKCNVLVYSHTFYQNGEFYTNIYFRMDDIDYYVMIMSPVVGRGEFYVKSLTA